ncbi:MAG: hemolysin family protein, partial [Rickettsiales bacterium]|nr:hemolysin family protein [Rickettsiales bacterium]
EERNLLRNMIAFGELKVGDVMIPRTDICAAPLDITYDDMRSFMLSNMHTRIPIFNETMDDIKGFLHLKDFFQCVAGEKAFNLSDLMRDIMFVPPSMKIVDLLLKMRMTSCHIAIVVDEYGGTDGLVTMEDLFEEIVGEIQDEHDDEVVPDMVWRSERILEADARVRVEDLSEELQIDLINGSANDDFETLGGLIFSHLGRIPAKGEVMNYHDNVKLEILSADPRRIRKVKVVRAQPLASSASA